MKKMSIVVAVVVSAALAMTACGKKKPANNAGSGSAMGSGEMTGSGSGSGDAGGSGAGSGEAGGGAGSGGM